jgi:hypothetical protein
MDYIPLRSIRPTDPIPLKEASEGILEGLEMRRLLTFIKRSIALNYVKFYETGCIACRWLQYDRTLAKTSGQSLF